ncbi:AAA domain-containing protein [Streptomyces atriruber]|uniref:AAA domain-containing protein n=1 Tax=Streptomyces atriruber TaxID=545121 RepID=A0ABV3BX41_9ACTN
MTRLPRRRALLIGNEQYDDDRFAPLPSVRADLWGMRQVLRHRDIGAFTSIKVLPDLTTERMQESIAEFLLEGAADELSYLYVSGHGSRRMRSGGEFYFVATDTDRDRIEETGVGAGFVNELLEQCASPQKVVMIDCCRSGGFAVGLRTSDRRKDEPARKSSEEALLTSRGVFVMSSSRAGEDSFSGDVTGGEVRPSAFTAEVIEALRTGKVSRKNSGADVTVTDLFHYVNRKMRGQDGGRQVPVHSAHGVDDQIILAASPLGSPPVLEPLARSRPTAAGTEGPGSSAAASKSPRPVASWSSLLTYYRECVLAEETETPLLSVGDHGTSYVCLAGTERLLSGELDDDGCAALPPEAAELVQAAAEQEAELWTGYPAVLLDAPRGGGSHGRHRFAPLLVRRVEAVHTDDGVHLKPYGPVLPHPQLTRTHLGDEQAAQLAEDYYPQWQRGQHTMMADDIGVLLRNEYGLAATEELRPDRLAASIDVRTPLQGARNAAVLFLAAPETSFIRGLLEDFDRISGETEKIRETALAALSPIPGEHNSPVAEPSSGSVRLVTPLPCNEAQADVIRSAMTRRLTTATGPPGTGKSQLVTNAVATAVAAGQRVLVVSTNNEAVNEVWERCEELVPGGLVRTGSTSSLGRDGRKVDYRKVEHATLSRLRASDAASLTVPTARMQAQVAGENMERVRGLLAAAARTESWMLRAGRAREENAVRMGTTAADLLGLLAPATDWNQLTRKAERRAGSRLPARLRAWRCGRLLRSLRLTAPADGPVEGCRSLAAFAAAEAEWREHVDAAAAVDDEELSSAWSEAERRVHEASLQLWRCVVSDAAFHGRQRISELLNTPPRVPDWPAVRRVLKAAPAWAVTSLSARRFPTAPALFDLVVVDEASQCAIAHVLPLLYRARRALVIGDAMQLPHISELDPSREAGLRRDAGLRAEWLEQHRLAHRRHSAFHAAQQATGGALLLDEHFRCHPEIASLANELFYDGALTILTDVRHRPSLNRPAVAWIDVHGQAVRESRTGSWINNAEIEKVKAFVRGRLQDLPPEATIGVVTPFKGQAEELRRRLREIQDPAAPERLRIGTVHTFQGGQRDLMVFSLVAGEGMPSGSIGWVSRQLNLWNVAITRARSHLVVVGDPARWQDKDGVVATALREAAENSGGGATAGTDATADAQDDVLKRLYQQLSAVSGGSVTLGVPVHGHPVDAILRHTDGSSTAVLLDRGPREEGEDMDPARHLRLLLHRTRLLGDEPKGGRSERHAAWRLFDTGSAH